MYLSTVRQDYAKLWVQDAKEQEQYRRSSNGSNNS